MSNEDNNASSVLIEIFIVAVIPAFMAFGWLCLGLYMFKTADITVEAIFISQFLSAIIATILFMSRNDPQ